MSTRRQRRLMRRRLHYRPVPPDHDPPVHNARVRAEKDARRAAGTALTILERRTDEPDWGTRFVPYYNREGARIRREEFLDLYEDRSYRQLCLDRVGEHLVSTVWLGIDHGYGMTPRPITFETMILDGPHSGWQQRYPTEDCARCGHIEVMEALLEGAIP